VSVACWVPWAVVSPAPLEATRSAARPLVTARLAVRVASLFGYPFFVRRQAL
jgi:hypothetical protein